MRCELKELQTKDVKKRAGAAYANLAVSKHGRAVLAFWFFTGVAVIFRQFQHHFYDDYDWLYQALYQRNGKHSEIVQRVHVLTDLLPLDLPDRLRPGYFWSTSDGLVSDFPNSHQRFGKLRLRIGPGLQDCPPQDQALLPQKRITQINKTATGKKGKIYENPVS